MKIAIGGSRTFTNYEMMCAFIERSLSDAEFNSIEAVVSDGARGADTLAEQYARENRLELIVFPAEWERYGRKADPLRNVKIIQECDLCFAFWDGQSRSTEHDIDLCKEMGKKYYIYMF